MTGARGFCQILQQLNSVQLDQSRVDSLIWIADKENFFSVKKLLHFTVKESVNWIILALEDDLDHKSFSEGSLFEMDCNLASMFNSNNL